MKVKIHLLISICLLMVTCLCACEKAQPQTSTQSEQTATDDTQEYIPNESMLKHPYILLAVDPLGQKMMFQETGSGRQLLYSYNLTTNFLDKFGGLTSISEFTPGRICEILSMDENGMVSEMALSGQVWEFQDLENFSIDAQRGVFTVGTTNYRIPDEIRIFSDNLEIGIDAIGEDDVLRLYGKDKDIWSIQVTTGHGMLSLINTEAFRGGLICVGDIYTLVNGDMTIEVPEGVYEVTVANKGYGGSAQVQVVRDSIVTLDLDTIRNDGELKYCKLTFLIEVEDATIKLDGTRVNKDEILDIGYGRHLLSVSAPGYDSWTKYLYVNSEKATIMLTMNEEGTTNNNNNNTNTNTNTNTNDSDKEDNSSTTQKEQEKKETELEYLTTIRDMVNNITNNAFTS